MFVLDASVAAKWYIADEKNVGSEKVRDRIAAGEPAVAPQIFRWEIQNVFLVAERAGRIKSAEVAQALDDLWALPIHLDLGQNYFLAGSEGRLARTFDLTIYAAAYLDCAVARGAELITSDRLLEAAGRRAGLQTTLV